MLATVNNAAINTEVHVSFQITVFGCLVVVVCFFFLYIPRSGIARSYGSSIFVFILIRSNFILPLILLYPL